MNVCSNCGANLSCGCQKRKALDGTACCQTCIGSYEAKKNPQPNTINSQKQPTQTVAVYLGPGQQISKQT